MALGLYTNWQLDPVYMDMGYRDTVCENGNLFNERSAGTITLSADFMGGHGKDSYFWDLTGNFVFDRDPASVAAVPINSFGDASIHSPKLNTRIGPVGFTFDAAKKRQACNTRGGVDITREIVSMSVGEQFGNNLMKYRLSAALGALVGALNTEPAVVVDDGHLYGGLHGGAGNPTQIKPEAFIEAFSKLGECESEVEAVIAPTIVRHRLRQELGQRDSTFNFPGFTIYPVDLAGRVLPLIVTDNPGLLGPLVGPFVGPPAIPAGSQSFYALVLKRGAMRVTESEETTVATDIQLLQENLSYVVQGETSTTFEMLGFSFVGPAVVTTSAQIATGANWNYVYADIKRGPGAIIWFV